MTDIRIAKFIANAGAASRRAAEEMIAAGRVTVNGEKITSPVFFVGPSDVVAIDGRDIVAREKTHLFVFHKPINTMTTRRDPNARKTIYDCLPPEYQNLIYVGRLDFKTTGLLLLTDDGDLARRLTLPSSKIPRVYIADCGTVRDAQFNSARRGMTVDGVRYAPMQIEILSDGNLCVTVHEGKKNEVRNVLRACGAPVRKLHRVSFGNIELGNLGTGKITPVSQKVIDAMLKSL